LSVKFEKRWEDDRSESQELMQQREKAMIKIGAGGWNAEMRDTVAIKLPYLANFSDDPHLSGRLMLHPEENGKDYSVGFGEQCDFMIPHGLGIASRHCLIKRDHGRLYMRPVNRRGSKASEQSQGRGVTSAEVNGVKVEAEWVELQHQDCVVLGRSLMFYAFSKPDGGMDSLPASKQQLPGGKEGSEATETLLRNILGPGRADNDEQFEFAHEYYTQLLKQNRNSEGKESLHNFLLTADRAMTMVQLANEITSDVKPKSDLSFELTAMAPVLAFGFGLSSFPELCVRLVRKNTQTVSTANKRVTIEKMRRQSTYANAEMLRKFTLDGVSQTVEEDIAKSEVIHTWNFPKFAQRLQLMQDVHQAWTEFNDPENFIIEEFKDPWSEYGLGEIEQLRQEQRDKLEEMRAERTSVFSRDSHLVHTLLSQSGGGVGDFASPNAKVAAMATEIKRLKVENSRLQGELTKMTVSPQEKVSPRRSQNGAVSTGLPGESPSRSRERSTSGATHAASQEARHCLNLSNANLSLVQDLLGLSVSLLRAGTATLQEQASDAGSSAAEQGRLSLADAASDLIAMLTGTERSIVAPAPLDRQRPDAAACDGPTNPWAHAANEASAIIRRTSTESVLLPQTQAVFVDAVGSPQAAFDAVASPVAWMPPSIIMPGVPANGAGSLRLQGPSRTVPAPMQAEAMYVANGNVAATPLPVQPQQMWLAPMRAQVSTTPGRLRPMVPGARLAGPN